MNYRWLSAVAAMYAGIIASAEFSFKDEPDLWVVASFVFLALTHLVDAFRGPDA